MCLGTCDCNETEYLRLGSLGVQVLSSLVVRHELLTFMHTEYNLCKPEKLL